MGMYDRMGNSETYFLFRKTVSEMLCDRGYDAVSESNLSFAEFQLHFGEKELNPDTLGFRVAHLSDPSNTVHVAFAGHDDVKVTDVRAIFNNLADKETLKTFILVVFPFRNVYSIAMQEMQRWPFKLQILNGNDLYSNAVRDDSRKYEVLSYDETVALFNECNSQGKKILSMHKTDPIARYYGLEEGQVIKIIDSRAMAGNDHGGISYLTIV